GRNVSVNGVAVPEGQPYLRGGITVTWLGDWVAVASGLGVRVASDGHQAVTVMVDAELRGDTRGLCGTYNNDPDGKCHPCPALWCGGGGARAACHSQPHAVPPDDFQRPRGDVAAFASSFGNSWKVP
ncbi:SSPO protein, partial [Psilopogon haemacephalus]|nr:SSPO protein [Psilopogon haemacephalus]